MGTILLNGLRLFWEISVKKKGKGFRSVPTSCEFRKKKQSVPISIILMTFLGIFWGCMVCEYSSKPEKCSKEGGKQKKKRDL